MAVTGVILIGFVIGHLTGNLQVFQGPEHLNGYAAFLRQTGPALWIARIVLIAAVLIHIWAATVLTLENRTARGGAYGFSHTIQATLASRTMRWTGYIVLAFIFFHLAHFTFGGVDAATYKENLARYTLQEDYHVLGLVAVPKGAVVDDVYNMVIYGFQSPIVGIFYIIAIGLLSFHLSHGIDSMFQTLGWRTHKWAPCLRKLSVIFCVLYFLGNLAIPAAVLTGQLKLQTQSAKAATAPVTR